VRLHEPGGYECRSAASSGPSAEARRLPDRRGHGPRRSRQPAGDIGIRRTTRVEDAPQLRTSSAYGSHPGLRPGLGHAPIRPGRLSTLLASVEVPATRCVNRHRSRSRTSTTVPAGPTPTSGSAGIRAGHRINAEATRGSAGAGERARRRRVRVPTAAARGRRERTDRTPICSSVGMSAWPVRIVHNGMFGAVVRRMGSPPSSLGPEQHLPYGCASSAATDR
jgi:hypothetical protein